MRRNYLNMEGINRLPYPPAKITSLARSLNPDGTATITITTATPHNVKANSLPGNIPKPFYVDISGATGNTNYNGRFRVISPSTNDGSLRTLQITMPDPGATAPTGNMILQDSPSPTLDVVSLVGGGASATITTATPHKRVTGDWVVVSGVAPGSGAEVCNGSFRVAFVNATSFAITLPTPYTGTATGMITLDRRSLFSVVVQSLDRLWGNAWIIEFMEPHRRKPEEWLYLTNVLVTTNPNTANPFETYVRIDNVLSPTKFIITIENPFDLGDYFDLMEEEIAETEFDQTVNVSAVPPRYYATPSSGGMPFTFQCYQFAYSPLTVVERNRILHALQGGSYHDTWDENDHIEKKNYHYDVWRGATQNLVGPNGTWEVKNQYRYQNQDWYQKTVLIEVIAGSPIKLRLKSFAGKNQGVSVGCALLLTQNATSGGLTTQAVVTDSYQDGLGDFYLVVAVPSNPFGPASPSNYVWQWKYFQSWRFISEDNIYEMSHFIVGGHTTPPTAFGFSGVLGPSGAAPGIYEIAGVRFYTFPEVVIRGNLIRNIDNIPDPVPIPYSDCGINIDNAATLIVEDNIINLKPVRIAVQSISDATQSFLYSRCGEIKCFNNQDMNGKPIRPFKFPFDTLNAPVVIDEDPMITSDDWLLGF